MLALGGSQRWGGPLVQVGGPCERSPGVELLDDGTLHVEGLRLDALPERGDLGIGGCGGANHLQERAGTGLTRGVAGVRRSGWRPGRRVPWHAGLAPPTRSGRRCSARSRSPAHRARPARLWVQQLRPPSAPRRLAGRRAGHHRPLVHREVRRPRRLRWRTTRARLRGVHVRTGHCRQRRQQSQPIQREGGRRAQAARLARLAPGGPWARPPGGHRSGRGRAPIPAGRLGCRAQAHARGRPASGRRLRLPGVVHRLVAAHVDNDGTGNGTGHGAVHPRMADRPGAASTSPSRSGTAPTTAW